MEEKQKAGGNTTVAPEVIETIIQMTANDTKGISRIYNTNANNGVKLKITDGIVNADIYLILDANCSNTLEVCNNLQRKIARAIKEMVGMKAGHLNIHVEDFDYPEAD